VNFNPIEQGDSVMALAQAIPQSNRANVLDEIVVTAEIDALNSALAERGISADRIVAVLPLEARIMVNPTPPQYRVLYRAI
jgi:hypothetical protein